ncbi:PilN domain-containing protein [Hyphomicrobium sp. DY-1]|uniref:PilN domain-containing protein n=1 Tax=Hyphomicrobium sp. DY-1 TaxID=3075650 RepID=UPI0039C44151
MTHDPNNQSRARRLYTWWLRELSSVITRRPTGERPWRTMLFHTAGGLQIFTKGEGPMVCLATLAKDAGPDEIAKVRRILIGKSSQDSKQILLRVSPTEVVQRTIRVPEAAADLMNSIVENKIETIVAWPQEKTYYGYRIIGPNALSSDQIDTEIVATTRQIVDSALERAREIGLSPRAVDFAPSPEAASKIELLRLEPDPIVRTAGRLNLVLGALVVSSFAICAFGVYQLWNRDSQYRELDSQIAAVMKRVDEVKRLNEENTKIRDERERLAKRKIDHRPVMELIEALSRALPDTAYLDEFEIHDNEARIVGKSPDPTGLISTLESTPEFEDVRFSAPTTRDDGDKLGTFSIVGKVQSEGTPEKNQ